jgi:hypothetical protein
LEIWYQQFMQTLKVHLRVHSSLAKWRESKLLYLSGMELHSTKVIFTPTPFHF